MANKNPFREKLGSPLFNLTVQEFIDLNKYVQTLSMEESLEKLRYGVEYKDEIFDRKKTAEFLGVSPDKVSALIRSKEIPGTRKGKEYFILKSELIKSLKKT